MLGFTLLVKVQQEVQVCFSFHVRKRNVSYMVSSSFTRSGTEPRTSQIHRLVEYHVNDDKVGD